MFFFLYIWEFIACKASKSLLDGNVSWPNPLIPHLIAFFFFFGCIFLPQFKMEPLTDWQPVEIVSRPSCLERAVMCSSASSTMDWEEEKKKRERKKKGWENNSGIEYKYGRKNCRETDAVLPPELLKSAEQRKCRLAGRTI